MKGIIFNLLERVVTEEYGADVWDDLIDDAGVSGVYTSLGNYSDTEIEALITAASARTGLSRAEILHWFGLRAMPMLRALYPGLFDGHDSSQDFVLSVNENIHPEVRKLYPDAACPFFHMRRQNDDSMTLRYESERRMIDLAHGFIDGAAEVYGDRIEVTRPAAESEERELRLDVRWVK